VSLHNEADVIGCVQQQETRTRSSMDNVSGERTSQTKLAVRCHDLEDLAKVGGCHHVNFVENQQAPLTLADLLQDLRR